MGYKFDLVSESEKLIDDDHEHGDFMGPELWFTILFGSMDVWISQFLPIILDTQNWGWSAIAIKIAELGGTKYFGLSMLWLGGAQVWVVGKHLVI